jgi:hypothetical protein
MLLYPEPWGRGISIQDACIVLRISEAAAHARLKRFKDRFPDAWNQLWIAKKIESQHKRQLKGGAIRGHDFQDWMEIHVKEKF